MISWRGQSKAASRWRVLGTQAQSSSLGEGPDLGQCQICRKEKARYTCSRCNVYYCSLVCYQDVSKHGRCMEAHARQNIEEALKDGSSVADSGKMLEMLRRFEDLQSKAGDLVDESDGEDKADALTDLLHELDRGEDLETLLSRMDVKDREEFLSTVNDPRRIQDLLHLNAYQPWWECQDDADDSNGESIRISLSLPGLPKIVHESVLYAIIDLILCYVLAVKQYQLGADSATVDLGAAAELLLKSSALDGPTVQPKNLRDVIERANLLCAEQECGALALREIGQDTMKIMQPSIVQRSLDFATGPASVTHVTLIRALDHIAHLTRHSVRPAVERKKLLLKLDFFASYVMKRVDRRQMLEVLDKLDSLLEEQISSGTARLGSLAPV